MNDKRLLMVAIVLSIFVIIGSVFFINYATINKIDTKESKSRYIGTDYGCFQTADKYTDTQWEAKKDLMKKIGHEIRGCD